MKMTPDARGDIDPVWIDDLYIYPTKHVGIFEACQVYPDEHIEKIGVYAARDLPIIIRQKLGRDILTPELSILKEATE